MAKTKRFVVSVRKDGKTKVIGVTAKDADAAEDIAEKKGYVVKSIHPEDEELELLGEESEEEETEEEEEEETEEEEEEEEEEETENGKTKKSKSKGKRKSDKEDTEEEEEEEEEQDSKPDGRSFASKFLGG